MASWLIVCLGICQCATLGIGLATLWGVMRGTHHRWALWGAVPMMAGPLFWLLAVA